jgi:CxxC-x17-CxxC domain-containing protein
MKNYNVKNRSERTKDYGKRRGKNSERTAMHHAKCNNCGKDCEVPFKPTSGKPIYCSSCFEKSQDDGQKKYGKERSDKNFKSGDSRKRSFGDRDLAMHHAVCDNCGKDCEVPFRPTKGKPIYCDKCFGNTKENNTDQFKKEFEILNKKLDKILEILMPVLSEENFQGELDEEAVVPEEPKPKRKTKKKAVTKKK